MHGYDTEGSGWKEVSLMNTGVKVCPQGNLVRGWFRASSKEGRLMGCVCEYVK